MTRVTTLGLEGYMRSRLVKTRCLGSRSTGITQELTFKRKLRICEQIFFLLSIVKISLFIELALYIIFAPMKGSSQTITIFSNITVSKVCEFCDLSKSHL